MTIVVDCNVVAYVLNDPVRAQRIEAAISGHDLLAPELLRIEFMQVLWKNRSTKGFDLVRAGLLLEAMRKLPLCLVPDAELAEDALKVAWNRGLTVYDALYAALALREKAPLATFDGKLREIATHLGITVLNV